MALQRVVLEAPAKINLFLDIVGSRPDGYHLLDTVMQAVSLCDMVVVGRRADREIRVTCSRPGIPEDERNLVHRAAVLYAQAAGMEPFGVHIHIDKLIPDQAGLGGGSADAAAALCGLNALTGGGLADEALQALALRLGADVPFLLRGGCARAQGIGERLSPLTPLPACTLLIAKPAAGMDTRAAYAAYDLCPAPRHRPVAGMLRALEHGDLRAAGGQVFNIFEQVCPSPATTAVKAAMAGAGALGAVLSGSGSAVAGLFAERGRAAHCLRELSPMIREGFLAVPAGYGAKILHQG